MPNKITSKNAYFTANSLRAIAIPIKSAETLVHFLAKTVGMAIS